MTVTKDGGRKKIKDLLINEKIPREDRETLSCIADGSEILWVIGVRMGESCKITDKTEKVLEIRYQGGE